MRIIAKDQDVLLIEKFNKYFIRFYTGTLAEIPIEYEVDKNTCEEIKREPGLICEIHNSLLKDVDIADSITFSVMLFAKNMSPELSDTEILSRVNVISKYTDIYDEFYDAIIYCQTFEKSCIKIQNVTAHQLVTKHNYSILDAYVYMVYLREHPDMAKNI